MSQIPKQKSKTNYYGLKKVKNDEIIIGAWDTETKGLGGELLAISYGVMGEINYDASNGMVKNFVDFI